LNVKKAQKQEGVVSDFFIRDGVIVNPPESASFAHEYLQQCSAAFWVAAKRRQ